MRVVDRLAEREKDWRELQKLLNRMAVELVAETDARAVEDLPAVCVGPGFECLLLEDCTGATDAGNHLAALKMVKMQGGVFGAVARSTALIDTVKTLPGA